MNHILTPLQVGPPKENRNMPNAMVLLPFVGIRVGVLSPFGCVNAELAIPHCMTQLE